MAWIYLAESADSDWLSKTGSGQLHIVSVNHTRKLFYCHECEQASFPWLLSGTMCEHLRANNSGTKSTSFTADSLAKISALLAAEKAWLESEVDFSSKSHDSSLSYDPDSCSWKTSQLSLLEDFQPSSESLPGWGMTLGGQFFQPKMLEPIIYDDDGFYLPTPMASPCGYQSQSNKKKTFMLPQLWKMGKIPTPMARDWKSESQKSGMKRKSPSLPTYWKATTGTIMPVSFIEWIMGYQIGATALGDLEMQWFRNKRGRLSKNSLESKGKNA